ncbi:cytochrome c [Flavobacterium arsenatis]|uniref:Cytochrome c n=1 Tax=Flavobacterium arsenatis TaxID=1484332 RepID=A0ABU1TT30_9FLAO|nr:c-type cytochrome [Flavobacterium arsenatis]MDR6969045.1 cytochrome c [Flavobacterium arsenatis]
MKKLAILFTILLFISCKKEEAQKENLYPETQKTAEEQQIELGQAVFEGKGNCFACHKPDQKIIGPSIQEIATIYKEKNADMVAFLKGKADPIVDPSQYEVMKTNFSITKNLPEEELKALEAYFYSFAK